MQSQFLLPKSCSTFTRSILLGMLFTLWTFTFSTAQSAPQQQLDWNTETVVKGIVWKSLHTDRLFSSWQNINVLEIDNKLHPVSIAYSDELLYPTSHFGQNSAAIAAVNGGFFDMRDGGSVTIMKVNGTVVTENNTTKNPEVMRSSLILNQAGQLRIEPFRPLKEVTGNSAYHTVFVTGPILVQNSQKISLTPERKFNTYRHPRTCACTTADDKLLLITVDGRRPEAAEGMTLTELANFSLLLGCVDTINLDGGGSTTMWIAGKPQNGVVNMPSDNGVFDQKGERSVANVLLVY